MTRHDGDGNSAAGGDARVLLVVEDEFLIAMDVVEMLVGAGYAVLGPAGTVADALTLLNDHQPDGAVLDVNLGTERATAVARELTARRIPYVLASAYRDLDLANEPLFAVAMNIGKPILPGPLLSAIEQIIGAARD